MELLTKLLEAIPDNAKVPFAIVLAAIYFGLPAFKSWRSNKTYWDFRQKEIELSKLYFEAEAARIAAKLDPKENNLLAELAAQRARLRPDLEGTPISMQWRIPLSVAGAYCGLLTITLSHYFAGNVTIFDALGGGAIQAVLPAVAALAYPARTRGGAFAFAFGAGLVGHVLFIAAYLATK